MTRRISIIYGIIIAIAIQVQAVGGIGVQVGGIVRRDESSPLRGIVPGVAVVEASIVIVVITAVADGVGVGYGIVGSFGRNRAVAPSVVNVLRLQIAAGITYILSSPALAVKKKPPSIPEGKFMLFQEGTRTNNSQLLVISHLGCGAADNDIFQTRSISGKDRQISGRKKDIIIRNSNNISTRKIEKATHGLSDVSQAAAVGVPCEECK